MEKIADVVLTTEEMEMVKSIAEGQKASRTVRARCRALLALAQGYTYSQCIEKSGVSRPTVARVKRLMMEGGIDAVTHLNRNPNSNHPKRKVKVESEFLIIEGGVDAVTHLNRNPNPNHPNPNVEAEPEGKEDADKGWDVL